LRKRKNEQPFSLQNIVNKIRIFLITNFYALSVCVIFVAHRPDGIQTARSLAESFRQRIQEISVEKIAQPSCSVCVPGGGVL